MHNNESNQSNKKYTMSKNNNPNIIIDSGASSHMISDRSQFINFEENKSIVHLAGDKKLTSRGRGDTKWLKDVLYVPDLKYELISISKLNQCGMKAIFEDNKVYVIDKNDQIAISGFMKNGLYFVDGPSLSKIRFNNNKQSTYQSNELNNDNESSANKFMYDNNIETYVKESKENNNYDNEKVFNKRYSGMRFEPKTPKVATGNLTTSTKEYMRENKISQYNVVVKDSNNESKEKIINKKDPGNAHACSSRIKTAEKLYNKDDHKVDHENNKNFQNINRVANGDENPLKYKMVTKSESPKWQNKKNKPRYKNEKDENSKCEISIRNDNPNGRYVDNKVDNKTRIHYNNNNSLKCESYDTFNDCRAQSIYQIKTDNLRNENPIRKNKIRINHTDLSSGHSSENDLFEDNIKNCVEKCIDQNYVKHENIQRYHKDYKQSNNFGRVEILNNGDKSSHSEVENNFAQVDNKSHKDGKSTINKYKNLLLKDDDTNYENKILNIGSSKSRKKSSTANQHEIISLHNRWGHPSIEKMKQGVKLNRIIGSNISYDEIKNFEMPICFTCLKGKMKVDATPKSTTDKSKIDKLEIICSDLKGPMPKFSMHKNKWFIIFVCAKTKFITVLFMKDKTETLEKLQQFKLEYPDMFGHKMKVFQCDEDKMFVEKELKKWCIQNQILLHTSPPYHHASNGMAERAIQTVMDKTITIMAEHQAPEGYWEEAVETAVYLLNRTPVKKIEWKTPYEALFNEIPDISHLVPFYSKGMYHLTKDERKNSLSQKSAECRMLGYNPYGKNQYKIIPLMGHQILNRRDVTFNEIKNDSPLKSDNVSQEKQISKRKASPIKSYYNFRDEKFRKTDFDNSIKNDNNFLNNAYWSEGEFVLHSEDIEIEETPKTLQEALNSKEKEFWIKAIEKELGELDERGVFELDETHKHQGMKSKMFYKIKYDQDMNKVYKARLVACGYSQKFGIDYFDTFSPTTATITFNIIIMISKVNKWTLKGMDIGNAFLEGECDTELYMNLPKDLVKFMTGDDKKQICVKIIKSIYGLKQAAKIFNEKLNNQLESVGFKRLANDVCLYMITKEMDNYYLIVHIDDIIITGRDDKIIKVLFNQISTRFKRTTEGKEFIRYLGIDIDNNNQYIKFNQSKYIHEIMNEYFEKHEIKISNIPMRSVVNYKLLKPDLNNKSILPITGKIRYCADKSRPDILYAINTISTQANNPNEEYITATIKLMKYLNTTINESLQLGGKDTKLILFAYSDASYITDGDSKSQLGNCFFLTRDSGAIYSVSKKDNTISHSSTESELKAMDMCVKTIIYLRNLLKELEFEQKEPTIIYVDNKSSMLLLETLKSSHKTKHINMRINFMREQIINRTIKLKFVPTEDQVADILTKALPRATFEKFRKILLNGFNNDNQIDNNNQNKDNRNIN